MAGRCYDHARQGDEVTPDMSRERKLEAIQRRKEAKTMFLMGRLWSLFARILEGSPENDPAELRCLRVRGSIVELAYSLEPKIVGPLLILDGTADEEVLRRFWSGIQVFRVTVRAEHYHLTQIIDRPVSMNNLAYGLVCGKGQTDPVETARARGHRTQLARLAEVEVLRTADTVGTKVAVFSYKAAAEALRAEHKHLAGLGVECGFLRPDGRAAGHFGAVRGLDRWRDVPTAIIAGRMRPSPPDLERQARAIFWSDPRPMRYLPAGENLPTTTQYLRVADGTVRAVQVECHPDPLVQRVLEQICRADLEQTAHRLRLVRRTAANPARVVLLTNVPLPLTVHEVTTWDEIMERADAAAMAMARGVFPNDWPGRAMVLADYFGNAKAPASAARQWFAKRPAARQRVEDTIVGNWNRYVYRHVGARKREYVWVDPRHVDARAAVTARLGDLDVFCDGTDMDADQAQADDTTLGREG